MKKAVLQPPDDFSIMRPGEAFVEAGKDCLQALPETFFYYDLPFLCPVRHRPTLIIVSDTDDTDLFVKTIESFAAACRCQILPKDEALLILSGKNLAEYF